MSLDLNEYQHEATKTAIYPGQSETLGMAYCALGLVGEAGEVANKVKKVLRDDAGILKDSVANAVAGELGDALWYLAMLANECGMSLNDIAQYNLDKLRDRQLRGKLGGSGDTR